MSAVHTPGPWLMVKWSSHAATTVVNDAPDGTRTVIAECAGNGRSSGECLADARLIAAAPDLLAALVEMIAHRDDLKLSDYAAITRARAAIAKATQS